MRKKVLTSMLVLICPLISVLAQGNKSEVLIISTIHGAHKTNPNYSYDSLFTFIEKYNPDIIGVEIRMEDMDSSVSYLKSMYPFEMYECITKYPTKKVVGFDWLGHDIAGKGIPLNYWKEISAVTGLEQKLSTDSILLKRLSVLDIIKEEMINIALNASLLELNDGRYDLMSYIYYEQLKILLQNTAYEPLSNFYKERDEQIAQNILEIIQNNKGKRMIFIMGADHRDYTFKKVSEAFGETILLNPFN